MDINPETILKIRKKWTKYRWYPFFIAIISLICVSIESNVRNIDRKEIVFYLITIASGYFIIVVTLSDHSIFIPYPTDEERIFKFRKTNVLIVDPFLDLNPNKKGKFNKEKENFQVDHVAWNELMDVVISNYQMIILDIDEDLIISWNLEEKIADLERDFLKVLSNKGTIIVFSGHSTIRKRPNLAFEKHFPKHELNVSSFFPFIPTKDYNPQEGSLRDFNTMSDDLQELFFSEGKINFRWFWTLDNDDFSGNCKTLAYNTQGDIISGIFFHEKGSVFVIPRSDDNRKIIKNILSNVLLLDNIVNHILETDDIDFSREETPLWVEDYNVLRKEKLLQEIQHKEDQVKDIERIKKLLYSKGRTLEKTVRIVLESFDFSNFSKTKEKVDLIFEDGSVRFVSEIKGLDKVTKPKNVTQLYKWIENERQKQPLKEVKLKGLFICNTERKKRPEEREKPFHKNLIQEAKENGWGLLTTLELFHAYELFCEGELSSEDIKKSMITQVGVIVLTKK